MTIPTESLLSNSDLRNDYSDAYAVLIPEKVTIEEAGAAFIKTTPGWLENLSKWKDKVILNYRQKSKEEIEKSESRFNDLDFTPGNKVANFIVNEKNDREIVFGRNDKHLSFRTSLFFLHLKNSSQRQKYLILSTVVQINNWLGKAYFFPVKPFHQEMAPYILELIAEKLNQKKSC